MFDEIIDKTLRWEGGYSNHKFDLGGATKFGVTQRALEKYIGHPVSVADVKNLTKETARTIYRKNYYVANRIDSLPEHIQGKVFDCCVNHGARNAIRILQRVINEAGFGEVEVDGVMGKKTVGACEEASEAMGGYLVNALVDARNQFFRSIVKRDPSQRVFLKGWLNRSEDFRVAV
jgi:lysozyme family protein